MSWSNIDSWMDAVNSVRGRFLSLVSRHVPEALPKYRRWIRHVLDDRNSRESRILMAYSVLREYHLFEFYEHKLRERLRGELS